MTPEHERELARLMGLAQQGDRTAYEDLLARAASLILGYVRRRVGDVAWADDVVQECLLAIHRARHTYDPARLFAPWMYAIAQNRLIDALRRKKRLLLHEVQADPEAPEPGARARQERDLVLRDVRSAVAGLPERQRRVIQLLKFEDKSVRDVARELGMSESNVKVTAHRGYRALRRRIEEWTRAD
jgi:RNA polymerase sigma-70 factor (ECF subfamily)